MNVEELWNIRGNAPVQWSIPFYVSTDGKHQEWAAFPAVPLLRNQKAAVDQRMLHVARQVNGMWMIARSELRRIGTMAAAGTDPETLLAWDRKRSLKQPLHRVEKNRERDEFLDALYQVGIGKSRDEIAHWWYLFCNHALDWIINKERPVDMFFARLTPVPYRGDWIERTAVRARWLVSTRKSIMQRDRLRQWFESGAVLGMNAGGTIDRQIVMEHMPLWWKTINRVEQTRLQRLKPDRYAACAIDSMRNAAPAAIRVLRTWMAQKAAPHGVFHKGRREGDVRLAPFQNAERRAAKPNWGTSQKYRDALWHINYEKFKEIAGKSKALSLKNGKLPAMPDIQPETQDVRDGGNAG